MGTFLQLAIVFIKQAVHKSLLTEQIWDDVLQIASFNDGIIGLFNLIDGPGLSVADVEACGLFKRPGQVVEPASVASPLSSQG